MDGKSIVKSSDVTECWDEVKCRWGKKVFYIHMLNVQYLLCCLCLKIINCSCRLFLMEEREENKLCHLFMGDLEEQWEKKKKPTDITRFNINIFAKNSVWKTHLYWLSFSTCHFTATTLMCFIWILWQSSQSIAWYWGWRKIIPVFLFLLCICNGEKLWTNSIIKTKEYVK